ncbi:MAG: ArnT family glycosyltransferase [Pyrinomonadaceae bacterium]
MLKRNLPIIIPAFIAILFSILAIKMYGFGNIEFGDTEDYINAANAFVNGTPYPRQSVFHPMFRPPLFSFLIAAVWSIFPQSIFAVKILQALLHGATVAIAYKIVFEVTRKKVPAFLGAVICAINPLLAAHTVDFYTEPLHTFLCALGMLLLLKLLKSDQSLLLKAFSAGIVFGLATLCRPAILGVAICLGLAIGVMYLNDIKRNKYLAAAAIFIFSIFLAIAPWTYYNYRTTGEFILINDGFGYNLWLGNLPETTRLYEADFESKEENQKFADYVWGEVQRKKLAELEQTDNFSNLSLNEREKVWRREAVKNLTQDYGVTARLMLGKLRSFWTPFLNHFSYGYKIVIPVAIFVIFIYIFGAYGAFIFAGDRAGKGFIILLAVTFVITTAIHVLIFGFVRYRVPNVDPYLSLLSGVAVWQLLKRFFPAYAFLEN